MENNHSDNYTPSEEKNHVDSIMKNVTKKYSPKQILQ